MPVLSPHRSPSSGLSGSYRSTYLDRPYYGGSSYSPRVSSYSERFTTRTYTDSDGRRVFSRSGSITEDGVTTRFREEGREGSLTRDNGISSIRENCVLDYPRRDSSLNRSDRLSTSGVIESVAELRNKYSPANYVPAIYRNKYENISRSKSINDIGLPPIETKSSSPSSSSYRKKQVTSDNAVDSNCAVTANSINANCGNSDSATNNRIGASGNNSNRALADLPDSDANGNRRASVADLCKRFDEKPSKLGDTKPPRTAPARVVGGRQVTKRAGEDLDKVQKEASPSTSSTSNKSPTTILNNGYSATPFSNGHAATPTPALSNDTIKEDADLLSESDVLQTGSGAKYEINGEQEKDDKVNGEDKKRNSRVNQCASFIPNEPSADELESENEKIGRKYSYILNMANQRVQWSLEQLSTKEVFVIKHNNIFYVGRSINIPVALRSCMVSRQHAQFIINSDMDLFVQDLKSLNGTFINGKKLECLSCEKLVAGDIVSFGMEKIDQCENDADKTCFFKILKQESQPPGITKSECIEIDCSQEVVVINSEPEKKVKVGLIDENIDKSLNKQDTIVQNDRKHIPHNQERINTNNNNEMKPDFTITSEQSNTSNKDLQIPISSTCTSSNVSTSTTLFKMPANVIDLTEVDDDDDGFACSQIITNLKVETRDDVFRKVKTELAEMYYSDNEQVLNADPIDVDEDCGRSGFNNTQDICAILEEGLADAYHLNNVPTSPSDSNSPCAIPEDGVTDAVHLGNIPTFSNDSSSKTPEMDTTDEEAVIPPNTEATSKTVGSKTMFGEKRRYTTEAPIEKKLPKRSSKGSINPMKFDTKDIQTALKNRRSKPAEKLTSSKRELIKERRRSKLREIDTGKALPAVASAGKSLPLTDASKEVNKQPNVDSLYEKDYEAVVVTNSKLKLISSYHLQPNNSDKSFDNVQGEDDIIIRLKPKGQNSKSQNETKSKCLVQEDQYKSRGIKLISPQNLKFPRMKPVKKVPLKNTDEAACSQYPSAIMSRLMDNSDGFDKRGKKLTHSRRFSNVDDVVKQILKWQPNWLLEQSDLDLTPPLIEIPENKVPLNFKSFEDYYKTFSRLILLENWQYIYKAYCDSHKKSTKLVIVHIRTDNDLLKLDCECYITQEDLKNGSFFRTEDLLVVDYVVKNQKQVITAFGVVEDCKRTLIGNNTFVNRNAARLCGGDKPHTKLQLTLTIRNCGLEINTSKNPVGLEITSIRPHLMLIRAIKQLKTSPICSMILKPKMKDFEIATTVSKTAFKADLNPEQQTIVLEAASLCTGPKPGIYCIKGPPGTGKSTVIVNIIFQILFSYYLSDKTDKQPPLILLTAPSNTAVDNLILKLVELKHSLKTDDRRLINHIKMIRVGPPASINKNVIGYFSLKLAERHVVLKNSEHPEIKAAMKRNEDMVEFTKSFFGNRYRQELEICEKIVIEKSNIICTTLNSCINPKLSDIMQRRRLAFTCCIIDEATQCHEIESLLPTMLDIDKLVLVGDPQQLNATIMNRDAFNLGFGQSLFTRLANNFPKGIWSPIKLLTNQYRMHPEICAFPNMRFYGGNLRSVPNCKNQLPAQLRRYLVFTLHTPNVSTDDYSNMSEVIMIEKILNSIFSMIEKKYEYTVGIITPYNAQKDLICRNIAGLMENNTNVKISTNTVDSFQGSEDDIVIISCVRDSSNSFLQNENRLNVALTRAKQVLYIIGNDALFKQCRTLYDLRENARERRVLLSIKQSPESIKSLNKYLLLPKH